mmetsp:Transcript_1537/g.3197  ORF Transcript_1537/g.3197 Transcript_1537/m.3197 type:complete len:233 (-) Transcript_1537:655-1353(-)
MHPDGPVEVCFRAPSLHGNARKLNDLPSSVAAHVDPEDLVGLGMYDELHKRLLLLPRQRVLHSPERRPVDIDVAVLLPRFLLRQPYSADVRVRENSRWDIRVVRLAWLPSEEGVGEAVAFGDGDRRQADLVHHVPARVDVFDVRPERGVDHHGALLIHHHPGLVEPEVLCARLASGCKHHHVGFLRRPIRVSRKDSRGRLFQLGDVGVEPHVDFLPIVLRLEVRAQVLVEPT